MCGHRCPSDRVDAEVQANAICWLITAGPLLSVCVAACDPVGSLLCVARVEARRIALEVGGLGSGDLLDG